MPRFVRTLGLAITICSASSLIGHAQASVDAMIQRANALFASGDYTAAADLAEQAMLSARQAGDERAALEATLTLVNGRFFQSRLAEGAALADEAIAAATRLGDADRLARAHNMRGVIARESGDFDGAIARMSEALAHYRSSGNRTEQVRLLRNIGGVYWELGDLERAQTLLDAALQLSRQIGNQRFEAAVLESQGIWTFQSGDPVLALDILERARALADALNEEVLSYEIAVNIGESQLRAGRFEDAAATFERLLASDRADRTPSLKALCVGDLGYAMTRLGRVDEGLDRLREGLAMFGELGPAAHLSVVIVLQQRLGLALRAAHRNDEALLTYGNAVALVDRMRQGATVGATTTASVIASRNDIVTETVDLLAAMDRWDEAFAVAERHRARTFLDVLGARAASAPVDDRRREELLNRASALQKQLWSVTTTPERRRALDRQINDIDRDLERLSSAPAASDPAAVLDRVRVQSQLAGGTVLVEYLLGPQRSFAWAISRSGVRTAILPARAEIESAIASYRAAISRPVSALTAARAARDYRAGAARLHALVIAPLEAAIDGAQRIIIAPDGALAYLPFETLSARDGSPALLERADISYVPSASVLGQMLQGARQGNPRLDLFAIGDPAVTDAAPAKPDAPSTDSLTRVAALGVPLTPLPFARAEVSAIAQLFPTARRVVRVGADGRENRIKREDLSGYRYLHFAAHGLLDAASPARSGIVLGSDPTAPDDGVLQVREVVGLQLTADVVTLSACQTGLGRLVNGEGVIGLSRAFLQAGARGVAVSLWNVNDAATAELMTQFYSGLRRNLSADAALRQAKLALLRGKRREWQLPFFWAPFIYSGS